MALSLLRNTDVKKTLTPRIKITFKKRVFYQKNKNVKKRVFYQKIKNHKKRCWQINQINQTK